MKLTIVGSGDAFASGGRNHTCFRLDSGDHTLVVDFGGSALVGWKKLGFDTDDIDAILLSHLHGDHFGGLPYLLLEAQFAARRTKPLIIAGPPGTKRRLDVLFEALYPDLLDRNWSFEWPVHEIEPGASFELMGLAVSTFEVTHPSGAAATGVRVSDGKRVFAYSGDTGWVDTLYEIADGADLFVIECSSGEKKIPNHIDWPSLRANLGRFRTPRIVVTHMGDLAMRHIPMMRKAGLAIAEDGATFEL